MAQQTRAGEQHQRERDLGDDQRRASARARALPRSPASLITCAASRPRRLQRRQDPEQHARRTTRPCVTASDGGVERDRRRRAAAARAGLGEQHRTSHELSSRPATPPASAEDEALGQQLPHEMPRGSRRAPRGWPARDGAPWRARSAGSTTLAQAISSTSADRSLDARISALADVAHELLARSADRAHRGRRCVCACCCCDSAPTACRSCCASASVTPGFRRADRLEVLDVAVGSADP